MIPAIGLTFAAARAADLEVEVEGLPSDRGTVLCSLYADPARWLDEDGALRSVRARPSGGRATCAFGDVPPGAYGVAFMQDLNDDGRMDYSFAGMPAEPWGVSRDAPARLGRPRWVDAVFEHPGPAQAMRAR